MNRRRALSPARPCKPARRRWTPRDDRPGRHSMEDTWRATRRMPRGPECRSCCRRQASIGDCSTSQLIRGAVALERCRHPAECAKRPASRRSGGAWPARSTQTPSATPQATTERSCRSPTRALARALVQTKKLSHLEWAGAHPTARLRALEPRRDPSLARGSLKANSPIRQRTSAPRVQRTAGHASD